MQFQIYQWLVPLIGVFFISRTIYQYLHNKRSASSTLIWFVFWIAIMILAVLPDRISTNLAELFGFKSNVTAIIFVALGMLFVFIFYLSSTIERLETQVTNLVREIALREAKDASPKKTKKTKKKSKSVPSKKVS